MQTARQYLFSLGLTGSPEGRGRFSNEAKAALADAEKKGIKFIDTSPAKVQPTIDVNAKAVRKWASENGYSLGDRGRISGEIKQAYLDSTNESDRPAPVATVRGDLNEYAAAAWRHPAMVGAGAMLAGRLGAVHGMARRYAGLLHRAMPAPAQQPLGVSRQHAGQRHAQQVHQQGQAGEPGR